MNLSNCHYYVVIYNSRRCFRKPYNTLHGSKRCLINYKNIGFHCELHDRFIGLVLEVC